MIRRRSSQGKKEKDGRPADSDTAAPLFNFEEDPGPAEEAPLFNLEELHERRILSWSPEPEEDSELGNEAQAAAVSPPTPERKERPPGHSTRVVADRKEDAAPIPSERRVESAPARAAENPVAENGAARSSEEARPVPQTAPSGAAPRAQAESATAEAAAGEEAPARRRGRPRGRPRRQVHFHVDPDEERLLMAAVERYGSQQKGLIAALESLQEADLLRDEIERLRTESARYRKLLDEAESLFTR